MGIDTATIAIAITIFINAVVIAWMYGRLTMQVQKSEERIIEMISRLDSGQKVMTTNAMEIAVLKKGTEDQAHAIIALTKSINQLAVKLGPIHA